MKENETGYADLKLEHVVPSEKNYRRKVDKVALDELTQSVKQVGVLLPIIVRPLKGNGHYEIVAGYRRYLAATAAGLTEIPAKIKQYSDADALNVAMTENGQREDVNPMDEALGFKRSIDAGTEIDTIAANLGRPVSYVLGRVKLLSLCKEVRQAISEGKISLGHAQVLLRLRSKDEQKGLLFAILDGDGITVSGAKSMVRKHSLALQNAVFDTEKCTTCAYHSGNQAALFPELKDTDECSDPACFHKMTLAHYEIQAQEKEAEGFRVIRDAAEIEELGKVQRIVPKKSEADYSNVYPPKYKSECAKCTDHHVFYYYVEEYYNGKRIESGELCLNPKCLSQMFKEKEAAETKEAGAPSVPDGTSSKTSPFTLRQHAEECRNRFLIQNLPDKVAAEAALSKRFIIYHMLDRFGHFSGHAKDTRDEILKEFCPAEFFKERKFTGWEIYLVVMQVPEELLDGLLAIIVDKMIQHTDPKALLHMTPEAGIDMGTDFLMDKEFFNTKKKAELLEMAKDLALPVSFTGKEKKGEMVEAILALDLTGKTTHEVAESCTLKDIKDVKNPIEWRHREESNPDETTEAT